MIVLRFFLIILYSAFLFSCSEPTDNTVLSGVDEKTAGSEAPTHSQASITPVDATVKSVISLNAKTELLNGAQVNWYINGDKIELARSLRLPLNNYKKGDIIQAVITKDDKEHRSNTIAINNTPPVMQTSSLSPRYPVVNSTLTVNLRAADADGDVVSFAYKWFVNGKLVSDQNFLDPEFHRGDTVELEVTPYDNEETGNKIRLKRTVANALPVFSEVATNVDGHADRHMITASDPDGDTLTYKLKKGPDGMTVDPSSGEIKWRRELDDKRSYDVEVIINDNHGAEIFVPFRIGKGQEVKS